MKKNLKLISCLILFSFFPLAAQAGCVVNTAETITNSNADSICNQVCNGNYAGSYSSHNCLCEGVCSIYQSHPRSPITIRWNSGQE